MTILSKALAVPAVAAALGLGALLAAPASAQAPIHRHPLRHAARIDHRAARLEQHAARASARGHVRKAERLEQRAGRLDRRLDHRFARHRRHHG